jgi:uncharacterized protein
VLTAKQLIKKLELVPLPVEGGYFRQTYVAKDKVAHAALAKRYPHGKTFCTAIYFLLSAEPDCFSAMHRLLTDEIYHFYLGDPIEMLVLHPGGHGDRIVLGPDIARGQHVQFVVPRGAWQGSRLIRGGKWALLGTSMAPGYDADDFELGKREQLARKYPRFARLIRGLTRL